MHVLLTIPFSPYNEKARWALDRFGVVYRERKFMPVLHIPAVALATRLGRHGVSDRVSTRLSTPVLVTADAERLCDSHTIVRWVDDRLATPDTTLFPTEQAAVIEREFGDGLGAHARRAAYGLGLGDNRAFVDLARRNVGWAQVRLTQALAPWMVGMISRGLRLEPDRVERSLAFIRACFDDVGRRLDGRNYLVGDRLSAADLSFACMASPVLVPTAAEGFGAVMPQRSELTSRAAAFAEELRDTPAGRYALRLFREERRVVVRPHVAAGPS